ncbi:MAG: branched-chain amino acid ABC transporter substrate-binding protein, partial [Tabrizicola sp.]
GALASAGGDVLVVAGYIDQGGSGIVRNALDTGAFSTFYFPDGMIGEKLNENFGAELNGSYGAYPGTDSPGAAKFQEMAAAAGFDGTSAFAPESYDAAALIMLAMEASGSTDPAVYKEKILEIANGPADGSGVKILPGELGKALELIAAGTAIDYDGASGVTLIGPGESAGRYKQFEVKGGKYETVQFR